MGQVVYQNRIRANLRKKKGRKGFPGSFSNLSEGEETPPSAIAVLDDRLHQVDAFLSHLLGTHAGEFSSYFRWADSDL